ncbi:MAG TPA: PilT/PilU family type 4a pilus ATPase [Elusimicrobiota bacterium]|nr:PilT/PilU family type 4a pilus ATPase [Elusimicrobiota bacterium]
MESLWPEQSPVPPGLKASSSTPSSAPAPAGGLEKLLRDLVAQNGSDLHLLHGYPPISRAATDLLPMSPTPLETRQIWALVEPYLQEFQKKLFEAESRVNVSFTINGVGRFRMNVAKAQGTVSASIRSIPNKIYPLSALGLPPIVGTLTQKSKGIIFITGATGSGKSTTMAAMLDHINKQGHAGKVVTIEDPIETMFAPHKCMFLQREVGVDVPNFEMGIEDALRQDPDILCIGEMRTAGSIRAALTAAETGHLVLTTLHTPDAAKAAQRIVSMFPGDEQDTIRDQLCSTLEAVLSQELLPKTDKKGMVLAIEVLLATPAVRQLIRDNKLAQVDDILHTGSNLGMISKDASVKALFQKGTITRETAIAAMRNPQLLG